jgi:NAD(P)-dependent dehydrogenase (short-subunit alcohol dehydrogenase family)
VVTGATSGIGRATALALGESGAHVALIGRNEKAAAAVIAKLNRRRSSAAAIFFRTDLTNFDNVRRTAAELRQRYSAIDLLVNNAGARFTNYETNSDGIERTLATNHLGHFLLTALVLDRLLSARTARIITIGSEAHAASLQGGWLLTQGNYDRRVAYARSKLANTMFAYELARRLRETLVTSNAVDPGGVATNLGRNNGVFASLRHLISYAVKGALKSPRSAARGVLHVAFADELRGATGKYFREGREMRSAPISYDQSLATQLWSLSVRLTKLDASIGDAWRFVKPDGEDADGPSRP